MRHYSENEWQDYIQGKTSSVENTLMEQHLSRCEKCTGEYVNALEALDLMTEAPLSLANRVMAGIEPMKEKSPVIQSRQSHIKVLLRYAVAASITLALWHYGIFGSICEGIAAVDRLPGDGRQAEKVLDGGLGDKMVGGINRLFDSINLKGDVLFNEKEK